MQEQFKVEDNPQDLIFRKYLLANIHYPRISTGISSAIAAECLRLINNGRITMKDFALMTLSDDEIQENLNVVEKMHRAHNVVVNLDQDDIFNQFKKQIFLALGMMEDFLNMCTRSPDAAEVRSSRIAETKEKKYDVEGVYYRVNSIIVSDPYMLQKLLDFFLVIETVLQDGKRDPMIKIHVQEVESIFSKEMTHDERLTRLQNFIESIRTPYLGSLVLKSITRNVNALVNLVSSSTERHFIESDYDTNVVNPLRSRIVELIIEKVDALSGLDFSVKHVF